MFTWQAAISAAPMVLSASFISRGVGNLRGRSCAGSCDWTRLSLTYRQSAVQAPVRWEGVATETRVGLCTWWQVVSAAFMQLTRQLLQLQTSYHLFLGLLFKAGLATMAKSDRPGGGAQLALDPPEPLRQPLPLSLNSNQVLTQSPQRALLVPDLLLSLGQSLSTHHSLQHHQHTRRSAQAGQVLLQVSP